MAKSLDYRALTRAIMAETGENQAQLATRLKVSQPSVSRWASGKPPELHHAVLIESEAIRLGVGNLKRSRNMTSVPIVGYVGAGGAIIVRTAGPFTMTTGAIRPKRNYMAGCVLWALQMAVY